MSATAAGPTAYPFRGHRTVAEIWAAARGEPRPPAEPFPFRNHRTVAEVDAAAAATGGNALPLARLPCASAPPRACPAPSSAPAPARDRTSAVAGMSVTVRVALGGRGIFQKKK